MPVPVSGKLNLYCLEDDAVTGVKSGLEGEKKDAGVCGRLPGAPDRMQDNAGGAVGARQVRRQIAEVRPCRYPCSGPRRQC